MVVFGFRDRTWDPFRESKIFFSQNLTYSYSFLGWKLPGITMSLESLHNYIMITVKCRKNDEKFGFFRISTGIPKECWNDCNITVISGKFHPNKTMWSTFFSTKKKIPSVIPKWSFSDFDSKPQTPFGNRQFLSLKI